MYFLRYKIPDEGDTKFRGGFRPGGSVGCFGMIVMFFVNKKVEKINKNRKSLISRNRGFKSELRKSVRYNSVYVFSPTYKTSSKFTLFHLGD